MLAFSREDEVRGGEQSYNKAR